MELYKNVGCKVMISKFGSAYSGTEGEGFCKFVYLQCVNAFVRVYPSSYILVFHTRDG
jgi:hypothetical protein